MNCCPNCGYCPHCGRGGVRTVPYYGSPVWPFYTGGVAPLTVGAGVAPLTVGLNWQPTTGAAAPPTITYRTTT